MALSSIWPRPWRSAASPRRGTWRVGCSRPRAGREREAALALLRRLAEDLDRTVRDAAGSACGHLLQEDFARMGEVLRGWSGATSPAVRRAVLVAAAERGGDAVDRSGRSRCSSSSSRSSPIETHRCGESLRPAPWARRLLVAYPDLKFEYLAKWSTSTDEQVLWNVAMAFSASGRRAPRQEGPDRPAEALSGRTPLRVEGRRPRRCGSSAARSRRSFVPSSLSGSRTSGASRWRERP